MTREILVTPDRGNEFKIRVPDDATMTFGPFSPPSKEGKTYGNEATSRGTLRVYDGTKATANKVIGVFTGVQSFRDLRSIDLVEKLAVEEGATMWKSDSNGYERTTKAKHAAYFEDEAKPLLGSGDDDEEAF